MKINFDVYFISQCVGGKCCEPGKCKETKLCPVCAQTNFFLAVPLTMNMEFFLTGATKIFREFNPGRGICPVSTMYISASYWAGMMEAEALFTPNQKMHSKNQENWHKLVRQKRMVGAKMWKIGKEEFDRKRTAYQQSPTPVDTLEFFRFLEERLYTAVAIFDQVNGDARDVNDPECCNWYRSLREQGVENPDWRQGKEWLMDMYGTRTLIKWTKDMEICKADNVEGWQKEVDKFNKMRPEITGQIIKDLALEDEKRKFEIVGEVVNKAKALLPEQPAKPLIRPTVPLPPPLDVPEEEEEDQHHDGEEEGVTLGPNLPGPAMSRIVNHMDAVAALDLENKPADYDFVREVYGKEHRARSCTVVEIADGEEEAEDQPSLQSVQEEEEEEERPSAQQKVEEEEEEEGELVEKMSFLNV